MTKSKKLVKKKHKLVNESNKNLRGSENNNKLVKKRPNLEENVRN